MECRLLFRYGTVKRHGVCSITPFRSRILRRIRFSAYSPRLQLIEQPLLLYVSLTARRRGRPGWREVQHFFPKVRHFLPPWYAFVSCQENVI